MSQSHSETAPSLRITRPFPALLEWARNLDLQNMDTTDHGHLPFVVILVRAVDEWRKSVSASRHSVRSCPYVLQHDGNLPKTAAEKKEFKSNILAMRVKPDEENFEEAEAQAWRVWSEPAVCPLPYAHAKPYLK